MQGPSLQAMSMRAVLRATVALLLSVVVMSVAGQANAVTNPDYTAAPPDVVVTTPGLHAPVLEPGATRSATPTPDVGVITPGPHAQVPDPGATRTATPNTAARDTSTPSARLTNVEAETAARQPSSQGASRQVETVVVDRVMRSRMPVTGSDVTTTLLAGLVLAATGAGLLAVRRRFSAASRLA